MKRLGDQFDPEPAAANLELGAGAPPLLTIHEVAGYLRVPVKTLYDWRHRRLGPKAMRVGRYVRYRPADVEAWLDVCSGAPAAGPAVDRRRPTL